jgi:hypothetical protein
MWLCDECGKGGLGGFTLSRDALHEHMAMEAHFVGWITWPVDGERTVRVEVIRIPEGEFYFRHVPFPEPGRPDN